MVTIQPSEDLQKRQENPTEKSSSGKIIDFFTAREALWSEARSADEQARLQQHIRAATRQRRRVHLSDRWEEVMLLLLPIAAVILVLLVIFRFG
jgi:hypothetical protein